jgi:hypothetical protein
MIGVTMKNLVDLTGILVPFHQNDTFLFLESSDCPLLPVFTNIQKYTEASLWGKFEFAKCIRVVDHPGFLKTVSELQKKVNFKLVVDPYINDKGNTCFKLITLEL